jgi:hypothetical protein
MSTDSALERLTMATAVASDAMVAETAARAEWARVSLLSLAEKHPKIVGFNFETEWEYDDEGGYFPTTSIYVTFEENTLEAEYDVEDAVVELQHSVTHEVVEMHLGETMTIQELKEVKF